MPRIVRTGPRWPSWRYGPNGESDIFKCEEDVPIGWTRKPGEVYVQKSSPGLDRQQITDQLIAKGITPHPTWGVAYMKEVLDQ